MGGYAGSIGELLLRCQAMPEPAVKVVAVCDPQPDRQPEKLANMQAAGVEIHRSLDALLASDIEAIWLPVPIDLHRPFTEQALRAGKPVMCEKPPAGAIQDLDAMARAARESGKPLLFGYQDMYDPVTLDLKRKLIGGLLGDIRRASVFACWPRDSKYYGRNDWAGKFKRNGVWVMDSPIMNALAHPVNQLLYLLGATESAAAQVQQVQAELYRANPIENFDTCSIRAMLDRSIEMTVHLTHSCRENFGPITLIHGSKASLEMNFNEVKLIDNGHSRTDARSYQEKMQTMVLSFARIVRGLPPTTALATPDIARQHLTLVNAASQCATIHDIDPSFIDKIPSAETQTIHAVRGIEGVVRACASQGKLFHELGEAGWARPASRLDTTGYAHFSGPA
jgi:predicted dehydrogenase